MLQWKCVFLFVCWICTYQGSVSIKVGNLKSLSVFNISMIMIEVFSRHGRQLNSCTANDKHVVTVGWVLHPLPTWFGQMETDWQEDMHICWLLFISTWLPAPLQASKAGMLNQGACRISPCRCYSPRASDCRSDPSHYSWSTAVTDQPCQPSKVIKYLTGAICWIWPEFWLETLKKLSIDRMWRNNSVDPVLQRCLL